MVYPFITLEIAILGYQRATFMVSDLDGYLNVCFQVCLTPIFSLIAVDKAIIDAQGNCGLLVASLWLSAAFVNGETGV